MKEENLIKFLKENLKISIKEEQVRFDSKLIIEVQLILKDEVISYDSFTVKQDI